MRDMEYVCVCAAHVCSACAHMFERDNEWVCVCACVCDRDAVWVWVWGKEGRLLIFWSAPWL